MFQESICQVADGRLMVKLPFKDDPKLLGRSLETTRLKFSSLESRLNRNKNLRAEYKKFMEERLGHMELVTGPLLNEPHYYISQHCVFKLNSMSTNPRVVFYSPCPTSSYKSLNDILLVEPLSQSNLILLLIKFNLTHRPHLSIRSLFQLADQHARAHKIGAEAVKIFLKPMILCKIQTEVIAILKVDRMELVKRQTNHQNYFPTVKDLNLEDYAMTSNESKVGSTRIQL